MHSARRKYFKGTSIPQISTIGTFHCHTVGEKGIMYKCTSQSEISINGTFTVIHSVGREHSNTLHGLKSPVKDSHHMLCQRGTHTARNAYRKQSTYSIIIIHTEIIHNQTGHTLLLSELIFHFFLGFFHALFFHFFLHIFCALIFCVFLPGVCAALLTGLLLLFLALFLLFLLPKLCLSLLFLSSLLLLQGLLCAVA